jgi:hypothetical protein
MASDNDNHGAEEARAWQRATQKSDAKFRAAMRAAGYRSATVTQPQTQYPRRVPHQSPPASRAGSPGAMCAELGSQGGRGHAFDPAKFY